MSIEGRYQMREYRLGALTVAPLTPTIGARVRGPDLRATGWAAGELAEALRRHSVLFFEAPGLMPAEHVALARRFGPLQSYARQPTAGARELPPEVHVFDYDASRRGKEAFWHFDVLPCRRPARAALLRARAVPDVGGDTLFCDTAAVFGGLPPALAARVLGASAFYDLVFERRLARFRGASDTEAMALSPEPLVEFPMLLERGDGRRMLFFNPAFFVGMRGVEPQRSRDLAAELRTRIDRPDYQCRFSWRADDLAFWDNYACLHYATNDYFPERRVMERVTVTEGDGRGLLDDPAVALALSPRPAVTTKGAAGRAHAPSVVAP